MAGLEPASPGLASGRSLAVELHPQFCFVFRAIIHNRGPSKLVRKPGFAPGPSASQAEMLLLHHNPELKIREICTLHSPFCIKKWSPWSDSHRRIRVYETRPVAAEGTGAEQNAECRMKNDEFRMPAMRAPFCTLHSAFFIQKWRSHVDLHHEPPPSQSGVHIYLHLESETKLASVAGLAPARPGLKDRPLELLCIHGRLNFRN